MDIPRLQKTLEAAGFTVQWFPTAQAAKEALVARFAGKTHRHGRQRDPAGPGPV